MPDLVSPAVPARDGGMGAGDWLMLGGGLLLVGGVSVLALRRKSVPSRIQEADLEPAAEAPMAPPVMQRPIVPAAEPVAASAGYSMQPPVLKRSAPVMAQPESLDDRHAALEAMVAEAPSDANPFRTRAKRLRRAEFLLRQQAGGSMAASDGARAAASTTAPADRWSVADFGGRATSRKPLRPAQG